jgi:hypothetical protein
MLETRREQISAALRSEFEYGRAAALDPTNAAAVAGGKAVTTLRSSWLHQRCPTCGHTFRLGDEVEVEQDGTVRHRSAMLPCARGDGALGQDAAAAESRSFFAGLDDSWPPPRDLPVLRLEADHFLLVPPSGEFRRRSCAVCGHTFRLHDHVILCPCFPRQSRCIVAIHRDPMHGLRCWEQWNPGEFLRYCPATSRRLDE